MGNIKSQDTGWGSCILCSSTTKIEEDLEPLKGKCNKEGKNIEYQSPCRKKQQGASRNRPLPTKRATKPAVHH